MGPIVVLRVTRDCKNTFILTACPFFKPCCGKHPFFWCDNINIRWCQHGCGLMTSALSSQNDVSCKSEKEHISPARFCGVFAYVYTNFLILRKTLLLTINASFQLYLFKFISLYFGLSFIYILHIGGALVGTIKSFVIVTVVVITTSLHATGLSTTD